MKNSTSFLVSVIFAILIWLASPVITGYKEPWDANNFYYVTALVLTGIISGFLSPAPLWKYYVGALIGQIVYLLLISGADALVLVGFIFLTGYTLLVLLGAAVGKWLKKRFNKRETIAKT